jgi:L-ribulokinase
MKYAVGIDYGTQSARLILTEVPSGRIVAESEQHYAHGVMEKQLPGGKKLGENWAVQDADDYYEMIAAGTREALERSGVAAADVIGIGIDITSCTMMPVGEGLEPLSRQERFRDEPHAYAKMWKHHAAQPYADRLNRIARGQGMDFLDRYGGIISSEWMIPKIMQIAGESPEVYGAACHFAEVGDWLTARLTGRLVKSNVMAGYKSLWSSKDGYPAESFFALLDPKMENVIEEKLSAPVVDIGGRVGYLTEGAAGDLGLTTGTAVAVCHTDACVVPAGIGAGRVGQMTMSVGTSTCHLLLGSHMEKVPGICGAVENGTVPGFIAYEAGQAAVGDIFGWFVKNCVNSATEREAGERGLTVYQLLKEKRRG